MVYSRRLNRNHTLYLEVMTTDMELPCPVEILLFEAGAARKGSKSVFKNYCANEG